ncbi:MAG: hypothetical protein KDK78_10820 [Chlamydiia bacterium]|nr:hypothetical protein [Chlamydiia bacterium]
MGNSKHTITSRSELDLFTGAYNSLARIRPKYYPPRIKRDAKGRFEILKKHDRFNDVVKEQRELRSSALAVSDFLRAGDRFFEEGNSDHQFLIRSLMQSVKCQSRLTPEQVALDDLARATLRKLDATTVRFIGEPALTEPQLTQQDIVGLLAQIKPREAIALPDIRLAIEEGEKIHAALLARGYMDSPFNPKECPPPDLMLSVGPERKLIPCHREALESRLPYFRHTRPMDPEDCGIEEVEIHSSSSDSMHAFLTYLYSGRFSNNPRILLDCAIQAGEFEWRGAEVAFQHQLMRVLKELNNDHLLSFYSYWLAIDTNSAVDGIVAACMVKLVEDRIILCGPKLLEAIVSSRWIREVAKLRLLGQPRLFDRASGLCADHLLKIDPVAIHPEQLEEIEADLQLPKKWLKYFWESVQAASLYRSQVHSDFEVRETEGAFRILANLTTPIDWKPRPRARKISTCYSIHALGHIWELSISQRWIETTDERGAKARKPVLAVDFRLSSASFFNKTIPTLRLNIASLYHRSSVHITSFDSDNAHTIYLPWSEDMKTLPSYVDDNEMIPLWVQAERVSDPTWKPPHF